MLFRMRRQNGDEENETGRTSTGKGTGGPEKREVAAGQIQPASVAMRMASTRFLAFSLVTVLVR